MNGLFVLGAFHHFSFHLNRLFKSFDFLQGHQVAFIYDFRLFLNLICRRIEIVMDGRYAGEDQIVVFFADKLLYWEHIDETIWNISGHSMNTRPERRSDLLAF